MTTVCPTLSGIDLEAAMKSASQIKQSNSKTTTGNTKSNNEDNNSSSVKTKSMVASPFDNLPRPPFFSSIPLDDASMLDEHNGVPITKPSQELELLSCTVSVPDRKVDAKVVPTVKKYPGVPMVAVFVGLFAGFLVLGFIQDPCGMVCNTTIRLTFGSIIALTVIVKEVCCCSSNATVTVEESDAVGDVPEPITNTKNEGNILRNVGTCMKTVCSIVLSLLVILLGLGFAIASPIFVLWRYLETWMMLWLTGPIVVALVDIVILITVIFITRSIKRRKSNPGSNSGTNWISSSKFCSFAVSFFILCIGESMVLSVIVAIFAHTEDNIPFDDNYWRYPDLILSKTIIVPLATLLAFIIRGIRQLRGKSDTALPFIYSMDLSLLLVGTGIGFALIYCSAHNGPLSLKIYGCISTLVLLITWLYNTTKDKINDKNDKATCSSRSPYEKKKYPSDTYSFLALYGPRDNADLFSFGLMVFLFQATLVTLMILSVVAQKMRTAGEVDNPDSDKVGFGTFIPSNVSDLTRSLSLPSNTGHADDTSVVAQEMRTAGEVDNPDSDKVGFGTFIPSNVSDLTRMTQIVALISYMVFADASLLDISSAVEMFPPLFQSNNKDERNKTVQILVSCSLRCTQGLLAICAVFLLVMTSSEVTEIILNFTAVSFISHLDELAFELAKKGKYGSMLEAAAKRIEQEPLPRFTERKHRHIRYRITICTISAVLFGLIFYITTFQESPDKWATTVLKVQFDENSDLHQYSGCYEIDSDTRYSKRFSYNLVKNQTNQAKFAYCKTDRRWNLLSGGSDDDPCSAGHNEIAHSAKTDFFDISMSLGEAWYSTTNAPLNLIFSELGEHEDKCSDFGDGKCDEVLNKPKFKYDEGDCCAVTCRHSDCGGTLDSAFGVSISSGFGYPKCIDASLVAVQIYIHAIQPDIPQSDANLTLRCDDFKVLSVPLTTNGMCNDELNKAKFKYDEGDCCASTCTHSNCEGTLASAFGVSISSGFGYPTCIDASLVAVQIYIDTIQPDTSQSDANLTLRCDDFKVLSVPLTTSMRQKGETVMVPDGSNCTMSLEEKDIGTDHLWTIEYTTSYLSDFMIKNNKGSPFHFRAGNISSKSSDFFSIVDTFDQNAMTSNIVVFTSLTTLILGTLMIEHLVICDLALLGTKK
eukprot:CAMPEP_0172377638 /NCGR_PEP_ID=MMETSP1060-20121228/69004_1 /TAXON_ID=37318 /ORGANISM="Pseudo-nitzschia pungens, Strain cf. cingulata" /LENGTH=1154 /DNA_ID=CAMNT_0013105339 /DNA_START=368 /DNA_END=3833 /DNA_ORIENTATION=+